MSKIITAIRNIRLSKVLMALLAGVVLFVSTACNAVQARTPGLSGDRQEVPSGMQSESTTQLKNSSNPRPEVPEEAVTNSFRGGSMNEFSDVDPRARGLEKAAADRAAALKENAERNVIDQTGDLGGNTKRILDKKGENLEDFGKNVQRSTEAAQDKAQGTAAELGKATKRGTENIKENTLDATDDVTRDARRAADNVKESAKETAKDVSRSTNRAAENVKSAGQDVANKAQRAADKTSDYVQDKAYQAGKATQRSLYKAGDKVGETVE
ncbi:hypothetical protein [Chroogloeocystis siderophila]|jgi:ElaB/YqjD/DUF883 family membrane-anchored ribosome-binding protein|uniref:Uncharacterized protein n=1 Tax=Chroogloeocystis siderophila 5.2 s.c.1 TaxID=247279 RepID=A0A1U7HK87_9CHRO|nr:hypothetical protein [Chroogloeocystis siderophila]OKH24003.1 hypothetical protein NIES1031_17110 [Chroogloeocystis siderophila 5.2 s.c.1]